MEKFDLFNVPINKFYNKIDGTTTCSHKLKKELKIKVPEIFSEGLGFCSNVKAKFAVKKYYIGFSTKKEKYLMRRLKLLIKN